MPYLQRPRLHFAGRFLADVSTVNNEPLHFDTPAFNPDWDKLQGPHMKPPNGWWNPTGTGNFDLTSCAVTSVCYRNGSRATSAAADPAVGMQLQCTPGKLVDLDSQQQMVSQIFGLGMNLVATGGTLLTSTFAVAPFTDIYMPNVFTPTPALGQPATPQYTPWARMPATGGDQSAGAVYQSQLVGVAWNAKAVKASKSTFLAELLAAAGKKPLSIRFNVDGIVMDATSTFFCTGRVVGTIGVAQDDEPQHLTRGRQLFSLAVQNAPPAMTPPLPGPVQYNYAVALVDAKARKVVVDIGNALASNLANTANTANSALDTFIDAGRVAVGYATDSGFTPLGDVPYTGAGWYQQTAAVVDLPADRDLTDAELKTLQTAPLRLVTIDASGNVTAQSQEALDGTHVRADDFVLRMSPGDTKTVTLYATQFGKPLKNATISLVMDNTGMQSQQNAVLGLGPGVGTPPGALTFPPTVKTDKDGKATVTIAAGDPGQPRRFADGGFIDGQVYGIRPLFHGTYSGFASNPSDFISILLWSAYKAPAKPTWADVAPILLQYYTLYPVMKNIVDLSSYDSVVANKSQIDAALALSVNDPGYMPVTRDLSPAKVAMIRKWIKNGTPKA